jgi:hypothetical protein
VLVRAAEKGIAGDGRVKMCNSKDAFEAACNAAGDNLVRARSEDRSNRPSSFLLFFFTRKIFATWIGSIDRFISLTPPPAAPSSIESTKPTGRGADLHEDVRPVQGCLPALRETQRGARGRDVL